MRCSAMRAHDVGEIMDELFWTRALAAAAECGELERGCTLIDARGRSPKALKTSWALLNSKEFVFRR